MAFRVTSPGMQTASLSRIPSWLTARRWEMAQRVPDIKMLLL